MDKSQVLKQLERAVIKRRAALALEISKLERVVKVKRDASYETRRLESIKLESAKLRARTLCGLTYKVRDAIFSNATGTCEFYPETMSAHSYRWYSLVKKINGVVVLNDYRYSQQTSGHIWKVRDVLKTLGIKFETLEAPKGLQDLDRALEYELECQASRVIASKYGRDKRKLKYAIQDTKALKLLASFGYKASKTMRAAALKQAETNRRERLDRIKRDRVEKKAMAALEILTDPQGTMHELDGFHAQLSHSWSWNENLEFIGRVDDWLKRQAVRAGKTRIIVHRTEKRHLTLA